MAKITKKPIPQSQIVPSVTVKGVDLADYTDYLSSSEKYITISKNKFWPVWINFLAQIDYATSNFQLTEEVENISVKPKYDFTTT